jgi:hypothetical protein
MEAELPKADPPKRKRRWFQFRLRSLLVVVVRRRVFAQRVFRDTFARREAQTMKRSRFLHTCLAMIVTAVISFCGCGQGKSDDDVGPNWEQMETILSSPETRTTRDLFLALSELPIGKTYKNAYGDVRAKEADFEPVEKNMAQIERDALAIPKLADRIQARKPDGIKKLLTEIAIWKEQTARWDDVKRVYLFLTVYPTKAERLAQWDSRVDFEVYTDDQGRILAWRNSKKHPLFSD